MLKERPGYLLSLRTSPFATWTGLPGYWCVPARHFCHLIDTLDTFHECPIPIQLALQISAPLPIAFSLWGICFTLGRRQELLRILKVFCFSKCWSLHNPAESCSPLPCFGRGVAGAQAGSRRYHQVSQVAQLSQLEAPAVVLLVKWRWIQWQWEQITLWVIRAKKASSH